MKRLAAALIGLHLLAAPGAHAAEQRSQMAASSVAAEALWPYFSPTAGSASGATSAAENQRPAVAPWWKPSPPPASPGLIARQVAGPVEQQDPNRTVTVVAGDSLWDIAARELGSLATDAEIAGQWPKWYAANRNVIGDDPSQLLPGQVLTVPTE
ncbi:LysM peptidoglycan-binding domain-containing protein [Crystallibacter crystallopoietes]|uniref:LysM peptidoglycan-binding domain-containing protein n=1 Tax=Crystallibacter crystallopoietes TaxID=37928 RepID=UPI0009DA591E|nr:LysM peptidoglycan-binding domain-containing protein [Arthrobacter crystallopoietes]